MRISNLIKKLEHIKQNKGDLNVCISDNNNILNDTIIGENIIFNCKDAKVVILI